MMLKQNLLMAQLTDGTPVEIENIATESKFQATLVLGKLDPYFEIISVKERGASKWKVIDSCNYDVEEGRSQYFESLRCPICGNEVDIDLSIGRPNYCSNCGARLDEE